MNPKVSVIIPAYNTERYIARAVGSALEQTERDIEVVVVDDTSTDATRQVVQDFSDERVKLFVNERNSGPSVTRNRAIAEARGEWIAPLDSDDWYAPERLEQLLRAARTANADMVADDVHLIDDGDDRPWGTLLSLGGGRFDRLRPVGAVEFVDSNIPEKRRSRLGLTKPLINRAFLVRHGLGYDRAVRGADEDFHFYLACLLVGARFVVLPEPYYFYRDRPGSLGSNNRLRILGDRRSSNVGLLQQESVKSSPELVRSLSRRLSAIEWSIAYLRVVQPIKRGEFAEALRAVARDPSFFALFVAHAPSILGYRLYSRFRRLAGKAVSESNAYG
ncbi:MAG: glycosyltransferase [Rubrobacter sp.]